MNRKQAILSYNALRGLCALGIFFHHNSYLAASYNPFWRGLYESFLQYGSRCTSFFFILSGFLLAYTWKNEPWKEYIKRKFIRLYPLVLTVFFLALGCSFVMNDAINGDVSTGSPLWWSNVLFNVTLTKAFVPLEVVFYSFHAPSWYISVLIGFYIAGYFFLKVLYSLSDTAKRRCILRKMAVFTAWVYAVQFVLCLIIDIGGFSEYSLYLTYINPYFRIFGEGLFGILLCEYMPVLRKNVARWNKTLLEALAAILFLLFFMINNLISSSLWRAWIWFIPVGFLMIAFYGDQGLLSRVLRGRGWQFFGKISFELYMTHAFVYEGFPVIAGLFSQEWKDWLLYHAGTRLILTLFLSILFAWMVHQGFNWGIKKVLNRSRAIYS